MVRFSILLIWVLTLSFHSMHSILAEDTPSWRLVVATDFCDPTPSGDPSGPRWRIRSGIWEATKDGLSKTNRDSEAVLSLRLPVATGAVRVELDAQSDDPGDLSIIIGTDFKGVSVDTNAAFFGFGSNGNTLSKIEHNGKKIVDNRNASITPGQWHHIIAERSGGELILSADGKEICRAVEPLDGLGGPFIALYVWNKAVFRSAKVLVRDDAVLRAHLSKDALLRLDAFAAETVVPPAATPKTALPDLTPLTPVIRQETAPMKIPCYTRADIELTSVETYSNPWKDVDVDAVFSGPDGQTIRRPAFWNGDSNWRLRFAPTAPGLWRWKTISTNELDQGLHNRSGEIVCVPYDGSNPNYRRGFLRISDDRRLFSYADGEPFFWLGDTHWMMPDTERIADCNHPEHLGKPCPSGGQFQHLASSRSALGFTVYQTYPNAVDPHWWASTTVGDVSGIYGRIDPERFRKVFDYEMDYLADQGFVIALGFGHFNNSTRMPEATLRRWARYLVARYGAHPVVWITCQEMNAPETIGNSINAWKSVAEEIALTDGYQHPHTAHQWVLEPTERPLWQEPWHNWFALQGGHLNSGLTPQARYAAYRAIEPTRPVLETEAMYEYVDCGGVADTNLARQSAWKAMLSGCAGYTFGGVGIWALKWDKDDTRWTNYNHETEAWFTGMALPGASQLSIMKRVLTGTEWPRLVPRYNDPVWAEWTDAERSVLMTDGNQIYLAYFYGDTSLGVLRGLDPEARYSAVWVNPRTEEIKSISTEITTANGEWSVQEKDEGDWLLVVKRTAP